ncbi:hypothetical protein QBC35DRAFT_507238 [Podospora australis]|uniref:Carbohydrate-binding module family 19 domain-containing protein n=1 Tax=Podospora australis TaxID=1536484 RepID=A0AAN7ACQ9_9PEZI|nr:hypothetical protein QBC35DRAFT_507238 [Podospora australis]
MKFTTTPLLTLALAAGTSTVSATPTPSHSPPCTFGTYRCTNPATGIEICTINQQWTLVGPCPSGTSCTNLPQNGFTLPFCTNNPPAAPTAVQEKRNGRPGQSPGENCTTAGQYDCFGPYAIQVCNTQNVLELVGNCPERSHCEYLNGLPYCVANY